VQRYVSLSARALPRGDGMKGACPTWHGGVALSRLHTIRSAHRLRGGPEVLLLANGAVFAYKSPEAAAISRQRESTFTSDL